MTESGWVNRKERKGEGVTRKLAGFVAGLRFDRLPGLAIEKAKLCILDTLGCGLGGSRSRESETMVNALTTYDQGRDAAIWGKSLRSSLFSGCVINGTMAHTLEMDDVHKRGKVHAGAVVVPAVFGLGERLGSNGRAVVLSTVLGYEIGIRVAVALGAKAHRMKGWHATGTCGTFGGAAACAKLLGLDAQGVANTLGLAGTQSSGLWAFTADGSMSKRFHAGRAAQSGLYAAVLARHGFTGPTMILEAEDGGFCQAFSDDYTLESAVENLGERYEILQVSVKPYPCCRTLHGPIDAILKLKRSRSLGPKEIKKILVRTYAVAISQCGYTHEPKNIVDAQFSMPYALSVALFDGTMGLAQFSEDRIKDGDVLALAKRVELVTDERLDKQYPDLWSSIVEIETRDGRRYKEEVDSPRGDPENPLTPAEVREKFVHQAVPALGEEKAKRLADTVAQLEEVTNVREVIGLLIPDP